MVNNMLMLLSALKDTAQGTESSPYGHLCYQDPNFVPTKHHLPSQEMLATSAVCLCLSDPSWRRQWIIHLLAFL